MAKVKGYIESLAERVEKASQEKKALKEKLKAKAKEIDFMSPLSVDDEIVHEGKTQKVHSFEEHEDDIFVYALIDETGYISYVPLREIKPQKRNAG